MRAVLERVLRVRLDMAAVYAADGAAARALLATRLAEDPGHEFAVRRRPRARVGVGGRACSSFSLFFSLLVMPWRPAREDDASHGSESAHVETNPKN